MSCPPDTNGDTVADSGGYEDALDYGFRLTGHKMEIWELHHWRPPDDKEGTVHYPSLKASGSGTNCDIYGCKAGRVGSFSFKRPGSIFVSASAAIQVAGAVFIDDNDW